MVVMACKILTDVPRSSDQDLNQDFLDLSHVIKKKNTSNENKVTSY